MVNAYTYIKKELCNIVRSVETALAASGLPLVDGESLSDAIERVKHEREQCAAEVHRLREENSRLVNMLEEKRQLIVSFDGRSVFVDGMGELDVDSADALLQENAELRAALAECRKDAERYRDALMDIRDYWNRDTNEQAMKGACEHTIDVAFEALDGYAMQADSGKGGE